MPPGPSGGSNTCAQHVEKIYERRVRREEMFNTMATKKLRKKTPKAMKEAFSLNEGHDKLYIYIYMYVVELKAGPISAFFSVKNWSFSLNISFSLQKAKDLSKKKEKRNKKMTHL